MKLCVLVQIWNALDVSLWGVCIYEHMRWIMAFTRMKWYGLDDYFPKGISICLFKSFIGNFHIMIVEGSLTTLRYSML